MPPVPAGEGSTAQFESADEFLRRVHPIQWNFQEGRVSSAAFTDARMSVNWAASSSVQETIIGLDGYGVVSITAELCWELKQQIEYTPTQENRAHCEVVGRKTKPVRTGFSKGAKVLVRPKPN